jgi:hypothetical protein
MTLSQKARNENEGFLYRPNDPRKHRQNCRFSVKQPVKKTK